MKLNTITLTKESKLIAFEMPIKIKHDYGASRRWEEESYQKKLQAAIDNGVEFKDEKSIVTIYFAFNKPYDCLRQGKHYPVPDGYEIKTKLDCVCGFPLKHEQCMEKKVCESKIVAILVPKQVDLPIDMGTTKRPNEVYFEVPKQEPENGKKVMEIMGYNKQPTSIEETECKQCEYLDGKRYCTINTTSNKCGHFPTLQYLIRLKK
jgi:hypothetical protein